MEVFGKGISKECSRCGADGNKKEGIFKCPFCGYQVQEKWNTAQNAKKRGEKEDQELAVSEDCREDTFRFNILSGT